MRNSAPSWSAFDIRMMFQGYLERGFVAETGDVEKLTKLLGPRSAPLRGFCRGDRRALEVMNRVNDAKQDLEVLLTYRDFPEVFDSQQLPQSATYYLCYQLLRNVLAAHALACSFCVLIDARRPDLRDAWYAVTRCVKPVELRTRLRIATWQEVSQAAPPKVQAFLEAKYGIGS